jgi:hypothetical protein
MEFGEEATWGVVIFNKAEKQIIAKHWWIMVDIWWI